VWWPGYDLFTSGIGNGRGSLDMSCLQLALKVGVAATCLQLALKVGMKSGHDSLDMTCLKLALKVGVAAWI